jgi:MFS family permease
MMSVLLLFSSALLALLWPAVTRRKLYILSLAGVGVGVVLAFVYNWRTSYGLIMAVQVAVLLFIAAMKYYRQGGIFRRIGVISSAVFIGFFVFQAALIWPLEKDFQNSYSHHPIWHPIILGLGYFPNPLAEREGIKWEDEAAWQIAKRVDPNVIYLGPKYDRVLRSYYFQLWKRYPWEMVGIYYKGIFEMSRNMGFPLLGKLAHIVIWNGFIWFSVLLSIAIGGYFLISLSPPLAMFTIILAAALIGVSLESAAVVPFFTLSYQASLVVGFEALLAVLIVFAFASVILRAQEANPTVEAAAGNRVAAE